MQQTNKETLPSEHHFEQPSYTFVLKKITNNPRVTDVSVCFPILSRSPAQEEMRESNLDRILGNSYPVFNQDNRYFTPCFIIDADKFKVQKQQHFYLDYHGQRVDQAFEEKSQILVPRPSKSHNSCSLCRKEYQDYLQHVESQAHVAKVKKSKIAKNVQALQKLMAKRDKKIQKKQKKMLKEQVEKQKKIRKDRKPRNKQMSKQTRLKGMQQNNDSTEISRFKSTEEITDK